MQISRRHTPLEKLPATIRFEPVRIGRNEHYRLQPLEGSPVLRQRRSALLIGRRESQPLKSIRDDLPYSVRFSAMRRSR